MTIAAVAVLTLVAGGGGWLAGMLLAPPPAEKTEIPAELPANATGEEGIPKMSAVAHGIVQLDPITTNLAYPAENWVRLEVALQFDGAPDVALAETIPPGHCSLSEDRVAAADSRTARLPISPG